MLVLPGPNIRGLASMAADWTMVSADGDPVRAHPVVPLVEAFAQDHTTDAHLTCYGLEMTDGSLQPAIPRLTKPFVAGLDRLRELERELVAGGQLPPERAVISLIRRVVGQVLAIDFDLPAHVRWTDAHRSTVAGMLQAAGGRWPLLLAPTVFYATSGGFRLVWALNRPVDVHGPGGLEDLLYGLVAQAHIAGLTVDTACKDWTRLFRLPRVVRRDKPPSEAQTWSQAYYAQSWGRIDFTAREPRPAGPVLLHGVEYFRCLSMMRADEFAGTPTARELASKWSSKIGRAPRPLSDTLAGVEVGNQPTADQVPLLRDGTSGQSAAFRKAAARLHALGYPRDQKRAVPEAEYAYRVLSEGADIRDQQGANLHQGITKLARALAYVFRESLGELPPATTPQFLYALVVQPARAANAKRAEDQSGKVRSEAELDTEVWRAVAWWYRHYRGSALLEGEEAAAEQLERGDIALQLIAQVQAHRDVFIHALVEWSEPPERERQRYVDWFNANLERLLIFKNTDGKSLLSLSPQGEPYYSEHGSDWGDVLALGGASGHGLIPWTYTTENGEKFTRSDAIYSRYMTIIPDVSLSRLIPAHRIRVRLRNGQLRPEFVQAIPGIRTDIAPQYDAQVDEWLHRLAGPDVDELLDWLASFPRIDQPTCALYIQGHRSIGKGMLGLALKNLTQARAFASFDEAVNDFQGTMARTPFIWADERVVSKRMTKALMDSFKKLVSGEFQSINRKGKDQVDIDGYWRILATANHARALPWDEEVSGADKEAIVQRLMVIQADSKAAAEYLEQLGQRQGTVGWPETRIPAHIMHLAATRQLKGGTRFLVEPKPKQYHEDMQTQTTGSDEVMRLLGKFLHSQNQNSQFVRVEGNELFFAASSAYDILRENAKNTRNDAFPKHKKTFINSIKHVSKENKSRNMKVGTGDKAKVHKFWMLNMTHVIDWMDKNDEDCDLRKLYGEAFWLANAPAHVRASLEAVDGVPAPAPVVQPPPPPPPSGSSNSGRPKVLQMPLHGRQQLRRE